MHKGTGNIFSFGEFRIDTEEKLLWQDEKSISLPPKVMDILCLLVERQGKIVSKNEIMETVWADLFVEESNLTQSIYQLRRTLGTDENGKSIIETVPRRGFRIAVPVLEEVGGLGVGSREPGAGNEKTRPTPNSQLRTPNSRIIIYTTIVVIALILSALAYKYFFDRPPITAPIENVSMQRLTFSGDVSSPVISPDGKSVVYKRKGELFLHDINTGNNVKINVVDHKVFGSLQFSLDGESIYFRNRTRHDIAGEIFKVSRFGGAATKILDDSWSGIGLSPNGKYISFVRHFPNQGRWAVFRKDLASGEEKSLFERNSPDSIYRTGFPAWSPDSKKILAVAHEKLNSLIYVIDAETGTAEKQNTPRFIQIEQTVWSENGQAVYLVGREKDRFFQLWRMFYPSGELQRITNDLSIYRNLSLSMDGKTILSQNQIIYSHIWTATADNLENLKQVTSGNLNRDGTVGLVWTPDNNLIYASRITGNVDLWLMQTGDGSTRQLTQNAGGNNENPVVSPDGKYIYFESNRTGSRHIWRMDANGSNPMQITFSEKDSEVIPILSPDGNWLFYLKKAAQGNFIVRQNLHDNRQEKITESSEFAPIALNGISPDGKLLAFFSIKGKVEEDEENSGPAEIVIIALDKQSTFKTMRFAPPGSNFYWTSDSKGYFYYTPSRDGAKLWRKNLDNSGEPQLLLTASKVSASGFAWSPDGKNLAISLGRQDGDAIILKGF